MPKISLLCESNMEIVQFLSLLASYSAYVILFLVSSPKTLSWLTD